MCQSRRGIGAYLERCRFSKRSRPVRGRVGLFIDYTSGMRTRASSKQTLSANNLRQILWSMINPKVRLNAWLLKQADTYGPPRPIANRKHGDEENLVISSLTLSNLAKLPDFVRYPEQLLFDMQLTYEQQRIDIQRLRQRLAKMGELPPAHEIGRFSPPVSQKTLIYLYHTAYVLLLTLALILNGLLRALDIPDDALQEESMMFSSEVAIIAELMSQYRPLGAGYIPTCLTAAWAATSDPLKQSKIEAMMLDYQTDFAGARWMDGAIWLKSRCEALRLKTLATQIERQNRNVFSMKSTDDGSVGPIDMGKACCIQ